MCGNIVCIDADIINKQFAKILKINNKCYRVSKKLTNLFKKERSVIYAIHGKIVWNCLVFIRGSINLMFVYKLSNYLLI